VNVHKSIILMSNYYRNQYKNLETKIKENDCMIKSQKVRKIEILKIFQFFSILFFYYNKFSLIPFLALLRKMKYFG
jgi:hypothetical protein